MLPFMCSINMAAEIICRGRSQEQATTVKGASLI